MDKKRRGGGSGTPAPPAKKMNMAEEEELEPLDDEDVFLEETLIREDEEMTMMMRMEGLSSRLSKWRRSSPPPSYEHGDEPVLFQQLDIDYVIGDVNRHVCPNASMGQAAILRMFGVTHQGYSVCCNVHGFLPYFYICCPDGMGPDDIAKFQHHLEVKMRESNRNSKIQKFILRIEMVRKQSIMYYQEHKSQSFLKIVVALPTMVASCRGILERGFAFDGLDFRSYETFESNVLFVLRFMVDCNIVGGNWIELPKGSYHPSSRNMSYSQIEVDILYSNLISHFPSGKHSKMAPFRILSFDIECAGRKDHFPEANHDPVIQIANLVTEQGSDHPIVRNVMTLHSCSPISGVDDMSFDNRERRLTCMVGEKLK